MKIVYFVSPKYPYETVIYSGVGPRYAKMFGWPVVPFDRMVEAACDIGIIDNRTLPGDHALIDAFLTGPNRRFPIFFKLSDPDMPTYSHETARYVFARKDVVGVHYISIYDPEGPLAEFICSLKRSKVFHLPFPYDRSLQVDRAFADRRRRIFLSGASGDDLYPLRSLLRRQRRANPLLRLIVPDLMHPGQPGSGKPPRHRVIFERYIRQAAQFTHFFLCPSRYLVELMKFVECAYAGSVPIGEAPSSLKDHVGHCFVAYSGRPIQLLNEVMSDKQGMLQRASEYRSIMRLLRDPAQLVASLQQQIEAAL